MKYFNLKRFLQLSLLCPTLGISAHASATVQLIYTSTCDAGCSSLGLSPGNAVNAVFELNLDSLIGTTSIDKSDITSWQGFFGASSFGSMDTSNWDFTASVDSSGTI